MADLTEQIRARLEVITAPPSLMVAFPESITEAKAEEFRRRFDESNRDRKVHYALPTGVPLSDSAIEPMRAALLAVLDEHPPVPCGNVHHERGYGLHCAVCEYDDIERGWWPCPTIRRVAQHLGIEVTDD